MRYRSTVLPGAAEYGNFPLPADWNQKTGWTRARFTIPASTANSAGDFQSAPVSYAALSGAGESPPVARAKAVVTVEATIFHQLRRDDEQALPTHARARRGSFGVAFRTCLHIWKRDLHIVSPISSTRIVFSRQLPRRRPYPHRDRRRQERSSFSPRASGDLHGLHDYSTTFVRVYSPIRFGKN